MKLKYQWLITFLFGLFLMVNVVHAQWSALNSGYAVTTDYHGKNVMPGTPVTATAGTTDESIEEVVFKWKDPDENVVFTETVAVWKNGTEWDGKLIYYAQSSYTVTVPGDWGVQAFFIDEEGKTKAGVEDTVAIRATSFFVIPDFPAVGTAGVLIAMMLGLSLYAYKRKIMSRM